MEHIGCEFDYQKRRPGSGAEVLHNIRDLSDEDFEHFYKRRKDSARRIIEAFQLMDSPKWNDNMLLQAIQLANDIDAPALAIAIKNAQAVGELDAIFLQEDGFDWMKKRGYEIPYTFWQSHGIGLDVLDREESKRAFREGSKQAEIADDKQPKTAKKNTVNKPRVNSLDAPIKKAIALAGSLNTGPVFVQLRELALNGEVPFTGEIESDALCYTNDKDKSDKLTKNALRHRLKKHSL